MYHNSFLKEFCDLYNLKNLIKVPTCSKNADFPANVDVMLTTHKEVFIVQIFYKMIVTVKPELHSTIYSTFYVLWIKIFSTFLSGSLIN